jgi:hypothetical protein
VGAFSGDLLKLIESSSQSDLDAIDARIVTLSSEISARRATIVALKALRGVVFSKVNGRQQPKQPRGKNPDSANQKQKSATDSLRQQIDDLLRREGSMPVPAIAAKLGRSAQQIAMTVVKCDWFERKNGEVHVAKKG